MTCPKKIDINQSSLLGLKAELERKRQEVVFGKITNLSRLNARRKLKKQSKTEDSNKSLLQTDSEEALLEKSRISLETKAKTYDLLIGDVILGENDIDSQKNWEYLVDFEKKRGGEATKEEHEDDEKFITDEFDDEDEDWIDYVDCLGRTRRCHREDYETVKEQDVILKAKLFGECNIEPSSNRKIHVNQLPEGNDLDEKQSAIRQKWEEQERLLSDKKDVHYQDVLFSEARSHGVGYYEFSTDEQDRARQQEELKRTREETLKLQSSVREAAEKKKKQSEERLRAARKRRRERLGLPPEQEPATESEQSTRTMQGLENSSKPALPLKGKSFETEGNSAKPISIRPWDIGKEGVSNVLSQGEWVEKKRTERIAEFAPLSDSELSRRKEKRRKFEKAPETYLADQTRTRGVQIPPPESYSGQAPFQKVSPSLEKSIEEGLKFLKEQMERKTRAQC